MIVITRPSPYGETLTKSLLNAGIHSVHLPLFLIKPEQELSQLQNQLNQLEADDIVIIVSPQVIHAIEHYSTQIHFPKQIRYFAIGKSSAKLLENLAAVPAIYPVNDENSEALLSLPELSQVKNKNILILRGNNGRELLGSILQSRGGNVIYQQCYQRIENDIDQFNIQDWGIHTAIVITSNETLQRLEKIVTSSCKSLCQLVVTSPRLANQAKQLGWLKVALADSANNQILFRTIVTLCHNDKNYGN